MSFTWPLGLLLVLTVPLVLGVYLLALRRRRRQAITYSSLALLRTAVPRRSRWRRHLPVGLLLACLALLAVATARPQLTSDVPTSRTSIILALDDSASMCDTDVQPNRLAAAQEAARGFVDSQPSGTQMGLVVFSGFAELAVPPTRNRSALDAAINKLGISPGTAIGAAILVGLDAIAEIDSQVQPVGNAVTSAASAAPGPATATKVPTTGPKPGKNGYVPDVIVLMTDGANTRGIEPLQAVPYAVARRVRIYTIGFGTTHPGPLECSSQQLGGATGQGGFGLGTGPGVGFGPGGGFSGPGGLNPLVVDLPTLRQVSRLTGGASYSARTESQLSKVFATLPKDVTVQKEHHEITVTFAAIGALLALAAVAASIRWSPYP